MKPEIARGTWISSDVPSRLDALGWSRWHRRVVLALGITWILDGLEASLIANLAPSLQDPRALGLTGAEVGLANTLYLIGQAMGALVFGYLTDRLGRKRLFLVTLGLWRQAFQVASLTASLGEIERSGNCAPLPDSPTSPVSTEAGRLAAPRSVS
jgi:MFS family permease